MGDAAAQIVVFVILVAIGYGVGKFIERRHYISIRAREVATQRLPVLVDCPFDDVVQATLVAGSVVVSIDYYKRIWAALRALVGGRVRAYETVVDRARREAVLRMKEQAVRWGADAVVNMRVETSNVASTRSNRANSVGAAEVFAYGTAVKRAGQVSR